MLIEVANRQRLIRIDSARLVGLGCDVLDAVLRTGVWTATIAVVRDRTIRRLNRRHRGVNAATDVLSFPANDSPPPRTGATTVAIDDGEHYLGDVVISADTAVKQANDAGHTVAREIEELAIHGLLHLCGYDHETDNGKMNRLEIRLRRKLLASQS